jgi:hypothetical protein
MSVPRETVLEDVEPESLHITLTVTRFVFALYALTVSVVVAEDGSVLTKLSGNEPLDGRVA